MTSNLENTIKEKCWFLKIQSNGIFLYYTKNGKPITSRGGEESGKIKDIMEGKTEGQVFLVSQFFYYFFTSG